ncbi:MAG: hypothetical protein ACE5HO_02975 [bacterium]
MFYCILVLSLLFSPVGSWAHFNEYQYSVSQTGTHVSADVLWQYAEIEEKADHYQTALYYLWQFLMATDDPQERARAHAKILALQARLDSLAVEPPLRTTEAASYQYVNGISDSSFQSDRRSVKLSYLVGIIAVQSVILVGVFFLLTKKLLNKASSKEKAKIENQGGIDLDRPTQTPEFDNGTEVQTEDFVDLKLLLNSEPDNSDLRKST